MPTGRKQQALRKLGSLVRRLAAKHRLLNATVTANSSERDVVRIYRRLVKKVHPDKPTGNTIEFQQLDGAYGGYLTAEPGGGAAGHAAGAAQGGTAAGVAEADPADAASEAAAAPPQAAPDAPDDPDHAVGAVELAVPGPPVFRIQKRAVLLT